MNPLTTVKWPLIIGFVLAVAIAALVEGGLTFNAAPWPALTRWLHIIFGVFWIGLLYYFNAVQTPAMAVAAADKGGPGRCRRQQIHRAARLAVVSLVGARHLAVGRLPAVANPRPLHQYVYLRPAGQPVSHSECHHGIGAWFGTIMLFNVWGLIWPNQKKILGIVPATDEEKATARKSRPVRLAHQFPAVRSDVDVHDRTDRTVCLSEYLSSAMTGPVRSSVPVPCGFAAAGRRGPGRGHRQRRFDRRIDPGGTNRPRDR